MATVWTFGDSLTERYNLIDKWSRDYIEWKGYLPKVYGNFVSETLGYDLKNMGKAGCDNYTIFETFYNNYPLIEDNDVVIIGWTTYLRFRIVNNNNKWGTIIPNCENYLVNLNFSKNTIDEILINRDSIRYIDEINNWITFINHICSNKKILHWTGFPINSKKGEGSLNSFFFTDIETICIETHRLIVDNHFSEAGHEQLASKLVDIILNDKKPNPNHRLTLI